MSLSQMFGYSADIQISVFYLGTRWSRYTDFQNLQRGVVRLEMAQKWESKVKLSHITFHCRIETDLTLRTQGVSSDRA